MRNIVLILALLVAPFIVLDSTIRRVPFGGHGAGPVYLLARIPLQSVLIGWVYRFAVLHDS